LDTPAPIKWLLRQGRVATQDQDAGKHEGGQKPVHGEISYLLEHWAKSVSTFGIHPMLYPSLAHRP
jgi:hypothetical protein